MFEKLDEIIKLTIDTGNKVIGFLKEGKLQEANITISGLTQCLEILLKEFNINKLELEEKKIIIREEEILDIFKDMLEAMENKDYFLLQDTLEFGLLEILKSYEKQIINTY